MKKKHKSTYEEFVEDSKEHKLLDREYQALLVSELLLAAAMEEDHLSVRKLAEAAGVSPTIIQELRKGRKSNITLETLSRILDVIGYQITFIPKDCSHKRLKLA